MDVVSTLSGIDSVPVHTGLLQGQSSQYVAGDVVFKDLLDRIARRFPSKKAFADAMDIDPSRLTRAINAGDFPFNVENCLRLARLSGESPSEILRAAGKGNVADLIELLYGKDRTRLLTPAERELLDAWATMSPRARDALQLIIDEVPKTHRAKRKTA